MAQKKARVTSHRNLRNRNRFKPCMEAMEARLAPAVVLLNELSINQPGTDQPWEYVELKGVPNATLTNTYFVVLEGDGVGAGVADMVVNLSGVTLGSNGQLVIKAQNGGHTPPFETTVITDPRLDTAGTPLENGTISFMLWSSPNPFVEGTDYDANNDGALDNLPAGAVPIDSVGWTDGGASDFVYGGVALTQGSGTTPDAASRFLHDNRPINVNAWFNSDLTGTSDTLVYAGPPEASTGFPNGAMLTPGSPNFPGGNLAPIGVNDSYTGVTPFGSLGVSGPTGPLSNDTDPNDALAPGGKVLLTASLRSLPSNASVFTFNPDGSFVYVNNGTAGTDSFVYRATDLNLASGDVTVTINVGTGGNAIPNVDLDGNSASTNIAVTYFIGGGPSSIVDSTGLTVTDADNPMLVSATVVISNLQDGAAEILSATPSGAILAGDITYSNGTLSINRTAPLADYQAVLRSVQYQNTLGSPNTTPRQVQFTVNDGTDPSATRTSTVNLAIPVAPDLDLDGGSASNDFATTFTTGGGAVSIVDSTGLTVSDPDGTTLTSARVTITNLQDGASEVLSATASGAILPGDIVYSNGVLTITRLASLSAYQTVLRTVTYNNSATPPGTTSRVIEFVVNDGALDSPTRTSTVMIQVPTTAPDLDLNGPAAGNNSAATFFAGAGPTVLASAAVITDLDDANMSSATVTITNILDVGQETLTATPSGAILASDITFANGVLTITKVAPRADYEAVLRSIVYDNLTVEPNTSAPRPVTFVVNDGTSNSVTRTCTVTVVDNRPMLDLNGGAMGTDFAATFNEGGGPVAITDPMLTIVDLDSANLVSATVTITNRPNGNSEVLTATPSGAIAAGNITFSGGVLTITANATLANYRAVLASVRYENTSGTPDPETRAITFVANDGTSNSVVRTSMVSVATNDPVLDLNGPAAGRNIAVTFTANSGGVLIVAPDLTVMDADSTNLTMARVTLLAIPDGASESLSVTPSGVITAGDITYANGVLTIDAIAPVADYEAVLRTVRYNNTESAPSLMTRTANFTITDGTNQGAIRTSTITVMNSTPTILNVTSSAADGTYFAGGVIPITVQFSEPVFVTGTPQLTLETGASDAVLDFQSGSGTDTLNFVYTVRKGDTSSDLNYASTTSLALNGGVMVNVAGVNAVLTLPALNSATSLAGNKQIVVDGISNAPPINALPADQTVPEDMTLEFSAAHGNAITVNDIDAGATPLMVTVSVDTGSVTFGGMTGPSVPFSGTLSQVNQALDGLVFTPPQDFFGDVVLTVVTDDQDTSAPGGAKQDTDTLTITVTPVNDAPTVTAPSSATTVEDTPLVFAQGGPNALSVDDVDSAGGMVRVTLVAESGRITLAQSDGLLFTGGDGINDTLTAILGSLADLNAALDGLVFVPNPEFDGMASLTITGEDLGTGQPGSSASQTVVVPITVQAVNDAPINTVPGPQTILENTTLPFSASSGTAISISDVDAGTDPIMVTLSVTVGSLTLAGTGGLSFVTGDGTGDGTVTFTGTLAAVNAALDGTVYTPPLDFNGPVTLTLSTNDQGTGIGGPQTDVDTVAITVSTSNSAPTNTVPGPQTVAEDTDLVFSSANGNAISVADVDAGGSPVRVTLAVSLGTLTLANSAGLTFQVGTGQNNATMTFVGGLGDVNRALDGLTYRPSPDAFGPALLTVTTEDQGGDTFGSLSDSDTVSISVTPVNDAPTVTVPGPQTVQSGSSLAFGPGQGNALQLADVDSVAAPVLVSIVVTGGTVTLPSTAGLTFSAGDGTDDATLTFTAAVAAASSALGGLVFTPDAGFTGVGGISLSIDDQGNSGAGGPLQASGSVGITVLPGEPENQAPVAVNDTATTPAGQSVTVDVLANDSDPDGDPLTASIVSTSGGTAVVNPAGLVVFTPTAGFSGTATVVYSVSDGRGGTDNANLTISVTPDDGGNPPPVNGTFLSKVYPDLLGRPLDPVGMAYWSGVLAQGFSREQVALFITYSPEYQVRQVQELYTTLLNRPADAIALQNSLQLLANQAFLLSNHIDGYEFIQSQILASSEYYLTQGGGTNAGWLDSVYRDLLGRPLDGPGLVGWSQFLAVGTPREIIAQQLLNSTEGSRYTVNGLFLELLDRPADEAGLSFFGERLQQDVPIEYIIAAIVSSQEYLLKP